MIDHLDLKDKVKVLLEHGVRKPHTKNGFFLNVRNSTTLVNSLMNTIIVLKFIFITGAFRGYSSRLQDITS